jgi:hypothetical protein
MNRRPSNHFQTDRPESGGADRQNERENSGLLAREKQKFAAEEAEKARVSQARAEKEAKQPITKPVVDPSARKRRR